MKLEGYNFEKPNEEVVVIPREEKDVVFRCSAILDYSEFEAICKPPQPPEVVKPGGKREVNTEDEGFLEQAKKHAERRIHWLILKSLQATPGLEWSTVDMNNPKTWENWREEMRQAYFTDVEIGMVQQGVFSANSLNEERLEEARRNFLQIQEAQ